MMPPFQTLIDRLHGAENSDGLREAMTGFSTAFGFANFSYIGFPRPAPLLPPYVSNYPAAWVQHYVEQNYLEIDPIVMRVKEDPTLFLWDCRDPALQGSCAQRQFLREAVEFGIERGLAVPIHDTRCGHALLSLAAKRPLDDVHATLAQYRDVIHLGALYFHVHAEEKLTMSG
jgi:hypothetical protein